METEKFIKKWIPIAVVVLILLAYLATFIPTFITPKCDEAKYQVIVYCFGINLVLLVIGTFSLAFFLIRQWMICIDHVNEKKEKDVENSEKTSKQNLFEADTAARRAIERDRNQINDLFRLIDLSKDKLEETAEKTETNAKQEDPKHTVTDKSSKKNEIVNIDKLANFIDQYQNIISKQ